MTHHSVTHVTETNVLQHTCRFGLEPPAVSLGVIPYTQCIEAQFSLVNYGSVPFNFSARMHPSEVTEDMALCGACVLAAEKGHVGAFGRETFRLQVTCTLWLLPVS